MILRILNCRKAAMSLLLLTTCGACAQNIPERMDNITADAEAQRFFEAALNIPERIDRAQSAMLDNEIQPEEEGKDANFYFNPLLLNGKPLDYADFSIASKGILTVVEGDPESPQATKIPFRIYLRRDGEIITQGKSDSSREVFEIEIKDVLNHARDGDHLLIVPVRKTDWKAKRIIRVIDGC